MAGAQQQFVAARLAPRPPRVVVVVPGGEHWDYWVRLAMFDATSRWGGAGYVVAPHLNGMVGERVLEALVAYDPDFVVELLPTVKQREAVYPGDLVYRVDDRVLEGDERLAALERVMDDTLPVDGSSEARETVARVCTPHRQLLGGDHHEHALFLTIRQPDDNLPVCPPSPSESRALLACPPAWSGRLAVSTAARFGAVEEPVLGSEPDLEDGSMHRLGSLLIAAERGGVHPPELLVPGREVVAETEPVMALDQTMVGLISVTRAGRPDRSTLLVVGDTADDFALAMIWDRVYGNSVWLPSELYPTGDGPLASASRMALHRLANEIARSEEAIHLASCSLRHETLHELSRAWRLHEPFSAVASSRPRRKNRGRVTIGMPRPPTDSVRLLGVPEQYDRYENLPVTVDDDGTLQLPVPPPTVVPDNPGLTAALPSSWQIDIEFTGERMPRGRGIDGATLVHDDDPEWDAWVRSGRDGLTVHSHRYGLVLAGSSLEATIAKPRVREHGLFPWVRLMAEAAGHTAERSDAGRRAQVAEARFGGRDQLIEAMVGPLRPILRHFLPTAPRSADVYPDGHGVVLQDSGYLTFTGMQQAAPDVLNSRDLRNQIDYLLQRGVITRGLVLGCRGCRRAAFVSVDHLSQANECARCGEVSPLAQPRWRQPHDEPAWYYRLHWSVAELLDQHGDVPLMLAHELRGKSRNRYTDVGEVEFLHGGRRVAECDLIALHRGRLLIAEAKATDALEASSAKRRTAASKRVRIAAALRADEIVLGTTEPGWQQSSIDALGTAIVRNSWPTGRGPLLRLVTGLGNAPTQEVIDPHETEVAAADVGPSDEVDNRTIQ